ncbi:MAG: serine/threonine protein kinase [Bryobacterales bacterium]|nr:serine/threonine protein kinase [Bryobacterales bacterium]
MLGPYRIISKIGEGGMGSVWLGVRADEQFDKKVAIKVAPSALENEEVRIRFRLERQTLARLDHPNIVKLLDGGASESGIPYLVMDHVEGAPLDRFADEQKLSIEQRLALFRKICAAVHYAHQHLVVHRDLKPGNILVTLNGEPKLLDFGIAKMLDTDSARFQVTSEGVVPMTLRYGSPEQIRGKAVSAGSDIYALGVLLYELLTGHTPHYKPGVPAETLMYMILNDDPPPPGAAARRALDWPTGRIEAAALAEARSSTPERLSNQLAGDIDAIVLKALRKEPADRYLSVEHFSEDIRVISKACRCLPCKAPGNTGPGSSSTGTRCPWPRPLSSVRLCSERWVGWFFSGTLRVWSGPAPGFFSGMSMNWPARSCSTSRRRWRRFPDQRKPG